MGPSVHSVRVKQTSILEDILDLTVHLHCDLLNMNYCANFPVQVIAKMGTLPIIELFSPCKSWPNIKCECAHLVQYNPLFSE